MLAQIEHNSLRQFRIQNLKWICGFTGPFSFNEGREASAQIKRNSLWQFRVCNPKRREGVAVDDSGSEMNLIKAYHWKNIYDNLTMNTFMPIVLKLITISHVMLRYQ